jgi:hypothetical protein
MIPSSVSPSHAQGDRASPSQLYVGEVVVSNHPRQGKCKQYWLTLCSSSRRHVLRGAEKATKIHRGLQNLSFITEYIHLYCCITCQPSGTGTGIATVNMLSIPDLNGSENVPSNNPMGIPRRISTFDWCALSRLVYPRTGRLLWFSSRRSYDGIPRRDPFRYLSSTLTLLFMYVRPLIQSRQTIYKMSHPFLRG